MFRAANAKSTWSLLYYFSCSMPVQKTLGRLAGEDVLTRGAWAEAREGTVEFQHVNPADDPRNAHAMR
jgi:hypothetical protein